MRSDFERQAAKAAVDAVERRYWRDREFRERQLFRKRIQSFFATLILLLIVAIGGVAAWVYFGNGSLELPSLDELMKKLPAFGEEQRMREMRQHFVDVLDPIASGELHLLKEMPKELSIAESPVGTTYAALCDVNGKRLELYLLTKEGNGKILVQILSPFTEPQNVSYQSFKAAHGKMPFLISIGGKAYLCGSSDIKAAEQLRNRVIKSIGKVENKKQEKRP